MPNRLPVYIVIALPVLTGLVLSLTGLNDGFRNAQASSWATVIGRVDARYEYTGVSISLTMFSYENTTNDPFSYSYYYQGESYQGSRAGIGLARPLKNYKAGESVVVYVNPDRPNESVLAPGMQRPHIIQVILGLLFIWIGRELYRRLLR